MNISKQQTNQLKGLSILFIIAHNYFHFIGPNPGENEFNFDAQRVHNFLNLLMSSPEEGINLLFSFLGHYGVQMFVFLSGYGLAKSYHPKQSYSSFIQKRWWSLYPSLLAALALFLGYQLLFNRINFGCQTILSSVYKLTLFNNLIPEEALSLNGPWWFYSLIFQLYLIFPVTYTLGTKLKTPLIQFSIIIGWIILVNWVIQPYFLSENQNVYFTAIGHLPIFYLGIYFTKFQLNTTFKTSLFAIALVVFGLGNFYTEVFPFSFLSVTLICLLGYDKLIGINTKPNTILVYFGKKSLYLFAVNGFLRIPFLQVFEPNAAYQKVLYFIIFFGICLLVALCCEWITLMIKRGLKYVFKKGSKCQSFTLFSGLIGMVFFVSLHKNCPSLFQTFKIGLPIIGVYLITSIGLILNTKKIGLLLINTLLFSSLLYYFL